MKYLFRLFLVAVAFLLLASCSDDPTAPPDATVDAPADVAPDAVMVDAGLPMDATAD